MTSRIALLLFLPALLSLVPPAEASPGEVDLSFDPGSGLDERVLSIVVQPDEKTLIAGAFGTVRGLIRPYIARLNPNGEGDSSFDTGTGPNNWVLSVGLQAHGGIIIGGRFTTINGIERGRIARLNPDGKLDTNFNTRIGANGAVHAVAVQADGKILIAGEFTSVNRTNRNRIARLEADGSLDLSFNPGTGASSNIYLLALQSDGKVLIGGNFTSFNGTNRFYLARLNNDGGLDNTFTTFVDGALSSIVVRACFENAIMRRRRAV